MCVDDGPCATAPARPGRHRPGCRAGGIVGSSNPSVIGAYEKRIARLVREKRLLSENAEAIVPPKGRFEGVIGLSLQFLAKLWNIFEKDDLALKHTVLGPVFSEPLRHCRETVVEPRKSPFHSRC